MKAQEWLDRHALYVTTGVNEYLKSLVPGTVELLAAVSDTRHSPQGRKPHSFLALTPDTLIICSLEEKKLEPVANARGVQINTEAIPVSQITAVRREKQWGVQNGETWSIADESFTVRFKGDRGDLIIPLVEGVDSEDVRRQYVFLGEMLYRLTAK